MTEFNRITLLVPIVLTIIVIALAYIDLRQRRIPNLIVLPAALIGLAINSLQGWHGLWFGGKGWLIGLALLFGPYLFHVMGAGDVKFLAAVGAFVGGVEVVRVLLLTLLIYPLLALVFLIQQRKVRLTLKRFTKLTSKLFGAFISPLKIYASQLEANDNPHIASATTPFGLAISIGTLLALYTNLLR